ncbi:flippase activity-associated protein Agl23 [Halomarina oriensis]|uniref:TIGR03663 family protein n=1 Tax=Halomarina oriensis TaxID=671145 RepID=A0A6B0GNL7_9EURY|nr:flippase activity-associated protein Agl23 [Halomarina oriensis]MWG34283.1 TIGR03663 family protein [Halomarina oriensis]
MATDSPTTRATRAGRVRATLDRLPGGTTLLAVLAITAVGLLARLVALGDRIAHQDEARVAYWILRYTETGAFEYRAIIHGPFLPIVNRWVFSALGPSDFSARLVVALVGASMPLAALLFRSRLRDSEVVALALLLAFNPLLLYYSRFMRSDVLVAAFMLVSLGGLVRAYDTRHRRWLAVAVVTAALALSAKENALLYPMCWLGAGVFVLDTSLVRNRGRGVPARETLAGYVHRATGAETYERSRDRLGLQGVGWTLTAVGLAVLFFAVVVFFYAPRGGGYGDPYSAGGLDLYASLGSLLAGDPSPFLAVVEESTVGAWEEFNRWVTDREHSYLEYLGHYLKTMGVGALAVSVLALVGVAADRYGESGPRALVTLGFFWGLFSVAGYPIVTDIKAPWAAVHAVVGLVFPAAVGLAVLYRWGVDAFRTDDRTGVALAAVVLLLVTAQVGYAVGTTVYFTDHTADDDQLVQYAQSSTPELKTLLEGEVADVSRENRGTDILYFGDEFYTGNESKADHPYRTGNWFDRLPMAWYIEQQQYETRAPGEPEVRVDSRIRASDVQRTAPERLPPVVVTLADRPGNDGGERLGHRAVS